MILDPDACIYDAVLFGNGTVFSVGAVAGVLKGIILGLGLGLAELLGFWILVNDPLHGTYTHLAGSRIL